MKTVCTLLILFSAMTLVSCKKDLVGSGHMVTEQRQPTGFTGITTWDNFKVIIKKSAAFGLEMQGEDNVLTWVRTDVSGGMLNIKLDDAIKTHRTKQVLVTVSMPAVTELHVEGSGTIESSEVWQPDALKASINGSGDISLQLQGNNLTGGINGSGKLKLSGLNQASQFTVNGSGSVKAYDLVSTTADVKIEGSGNCELHVSNKLKVRISGSGKTQYKGNPNTDVSIAGSGKVVKVN